MSLAAKVAALVGTEVVDVAPQQGGDLSDVARVRLADGRYIAVKSGPMVAVEGRMLQAMSRAKAPVPDVLAIGANMLCLEWIAPGSRDDTAWREFGVALKRMHLHRGPAYGWDDDYAFGGVGIDNGGMETWPEFWARRRIWPSLPHLPCNLRRRIEELAPRLPDILPRNPLPGLLHGDLWSGNLVFGSAGAMMIDPACYHGHGEVDLAMLNLFGQPPRAFSEGYGPLEPGWEARRAVYQFWPAVVHYRLFGAGYTKMIGGLLERLRT